MLKIVLFKTLVTYLRNIDILFKKKKIQVTIIIAYIECNVVIYFVHISYKVYV